MPNSPLPLPRGWTNTVRTGVLHAITIASAAMTSAWSKAASGRSSRQRASAHVVRLETEIALLKEELAIKDARFLKVPARRRPLCLPKTPHAREQPFSRADFDPTCSLSFRQVHKARPVHLSGRTRYRDPDRGVAAVIRAVNHR